MFIGSDCGVVQLYKWIKELVDGMIEVDGSKQDEEDCRERDEQSMKERQS